MVNIYNSIHVCVCVCVCVCVGGSWQCATSEDRGGPHDLVVEGPIQKGSRGQAPDLESTPFTSISFRGMIFFDSRVRSPRCSVSG